MPATELLSRRARLHSDQTTATQVEPRLSSSRPPHLPHPVSSLPRPHGPSRHIGICSTAHLDSYSTARFSQLPLYSPSNVFAHYIGRPLDIQSKNVERLLTLIATSTLSRLAFSIHHASPRHAFLDYTLHPYPFTARLVKTDKLKAPSTPLRPTSAIARHREKEHLPRNRPLPFSHLHSPQPTIAGPHHLTRLRYSNGVGARFVLQHPSPIVTYNTT